MKSFSKHISPNDAFKYLLILFIILTSIKFYSLFLPYGGRRYVIFLGAVTILFFLIINLIYDRSKTFPINFKKEAGAIIIILFIGIFSAKFFHDQSIAITIIAQHGVYFILFYFLLHKLKPHPDQLLSIFIWLGYVYCILYAIQWAIFPRQIIFANMLYDRGTVRIFMPGSEYLFSGYFILLGRFFIHKKLKYIVYLIPYLIILLLMGTRQMIASLVLATLINILLSRTIRSKLFMYLIIASCLIPFYFLFKDIFDQMLQVTTEQKSAGITANIRYQAIMFYMFSVNPNPLWVLVGNGMPDTLSEYGRTISSYGQNMGFYLEDIGLFADLFHFGIILVIAKVSIYLRLVKWPLLEKYTFVRYNVITILLTLFTGGGLNSSVLALTCMMMYIADLSKVDREIELPEPANANKNKVTV